MELAFKYHNNNLKEKTEVKRSSDKAMKRVAGREQEKSSLTQDKASNSLAEDKANQGEPAEARNVKAAKSARNYENAEDDPIKAAKVLELNRALAVQQGFDALVDLTEIIRAADKQEQEQIEQAEIENDLSILIKQAYDIQNEADLEIILNQLSALASRAADLSVSMEIRSKISEAIKNITESFEEHRHFRNEFGARVMEALKQQKAREEAERRAEEEEEQRRLLINSEVFFTEQELEEKGIDKNSLAAALLRGRELSAADIEGYKQRASEAVKAGTASTEEKQVVRRANLMEEIKYSKEKEISEDKGKSEAEAREVEVKEPSGKARKTAAEEEKQGSKSLIRKNSKYSFDLDLAEEFMQPEERSSEVSVDNSDQERKPSSIMSDADPLQPKKPSPVGRNIDKGQDRTR